MSDKEAYKQWASTATGDACDAIDEYNGAWISEVGFLAGRESLAQALAQKDAEIERLKAKCEHKNQQIEAQVAYVADLTRERDELLRLLGSLEQASHHVLAVSVGQTASGPRPMDQRTNWLRCLPLVLCCTN